MVFVVFLAFFEVWVIHALKSLAWKSRDFFNQPNYRNRYLSKPLSIKTSIYRNFYPSKFQSFELQPHLWDQPLSIAASRTKRQFSSSVLPLGQKVFYRQAFYLRLCQQLFYLRLCQQSFGFPPQFSYWVRRIFIDLSGWFSSLVFPLG